MKQFISSMVLMTLMSSCTDTNQSGHTISVLEDRTETDFLVVPDYKFIALLFGLDKDQWAAATFRYGTLTDFEHNRRYEVSIKHEVSLFGNAIERKKKVADFQNDVAAILNRSQDTTERHHSSIWEPLVKELRVLQEDTLQQSTIYLFSDLRENSIWFSTYRKHDVSQLNDSPKVIEDLFLSKAEGVKSSKHLKIIVVYQPKTREEDQRFKQMSELYTSVFDQLDISIAFVANLNTSGYE